MLTIESILNLCHTTKTEVRCQKYSFERDFTIALRHIAESGDTISIERKSADPSTAFLAAWEALDDIAKFGFRLMPQIAPPPATAAFDPPNGDDIPF